MAYRERPAGVPGVVLWERSVRTGPARTRILPDGCLDLIWDGRQLTVAGPDLVARWHDSPAGTAYTALRFHAGTGPAALGVPASELAGLSPALDGVWPSAAARRLTERVAAGPDGPAEALAAWAAEAVAAGDGVDPTGPRVHAMAGRGVPVAAMAGRLGLSERQLRRRCLPLFGYGPRRLARILRMNRALAAARDGRPLADVAFGCGYADQAHLSRELLDLSGTTPTSLLAELGPVAVG
jgi:AraC-like DNA-binding protein